MARGPLMMWAQHKRTVIFLIYSSYASKQALDNIDHDVVIRILRRKIKDNTFLQLIKDMLKAGYMDDWKFHQTYSGTPQGGIVSPLLMNIALNELDTYIEDELILGETLLFD